VCQCEISLQPSFVEHCAMQPISRDSGLCPDDGLTGLQSD
jgi:hypothetical protein